MCLRLRLLKEVTDFSPANHFLRIIGKIRTTRVGSYGGRDYQRRTMASIKAELPVEA